MLYDVRASISFNNLLNLFQRANGSPFTCFLYELDRRIHLRPH